MIAIGKPRMNDSVTSIKNYTETAEVVTVNRWVGYTFVDLPM